MLSTERFIPPSTSLRQTVFFAIECKEGVLSRNLGNQPLCQPCGSTTLPRLTTFQMPVIDYLPQQQSNGQATHLVDGKPEQAFYERSETAEKTVQGGLFRTIPTRNTICTVGTLYHWYVLVVQVGYPSFDEAHISSAKTVAEFL